MAGNGDGGGARRTGYVRVTKSARTCAKPQTCSASHVFEARIFPELLSWPGVICRTNSRSSARFPLAAFSRLMARAGIGPPSVTPPARREGADDFIQLLRVLGDCVRVFRPKNR